MWPEGEECESDRFKGQFSLSTPMSGLRLLTNSHGEVVPETQLAVGVAGGEAMEVLATEKMHGIQKKWGILLLWKMARFRRNLWCWNVWM